MAGGLEGDSLAPEAAGEHRLLHDMSEGLVVAQEHFAEPSVVQRLLLDEVGRSHVKSVGHYTSYRERKRDNNNDNTSLSDTRIIA